MPTFGKNSIGRISRLSPQLSEEKRDGLAWKAGIIGINLELGGLDGEDFVG